MALNESVKHEYNIYYMLCVCVCATAAVFADTRTRPVFIAQRHMSKLNYHLDNPRAFNLPIYILSTTVGLVLLSVVLYYIFIYYKRV